jgi:hypothetical protein
MMYYLENSSRKKLENSNATNMKVSDHIQTLAQSVAEKFLFFFPLTEWGMGRFFMTS